MSQNKTNEELFEKWKKGYQWDDYKQVFMDACSIKDAEIAELEFNIFEDLINMDMGSASEYIETRYREMSNKREEND